MAGDWIKMRTDLFTHPKVVRISSALKADRLRTVGGLLSVWCLFDAHSVDGKLEGYDAPTLDDLIGWQGFSAAMIAVGWIEQDGEGLALPSFERHNGVSAKRRAQDADRKKDVRNLSASEADKKRTREEKRREEKEIPPEVPSADSGKPSKAKGAIAVELQTWIDSLPADEDAIADNDPIFEYADSINLPTDYVALAWSWFKTSMAGKRQKDWRAHFRNAVRNNWPKYWWPTDDGGWRLSPAGEQAKRAAEAQA
jgi:hypothetical protein